MSRSSKYLNVSRMMAVITSVIILCVMIYPGMDVKAGTAPQLYIMVRRKGLEQ